MKKLFSAFLFAASVMFAETRFSVGVNVGGYGPGYYQPQPVYVQPYYAPDYTPGYVVARPPYPGPGFTWVDGYWSYPNYGRRVWVNGYWTRHGRDRFYHDNRREFRFRR